MPEAITLGTLQFYEPTNFLFCENYFVLGSVALNKAWLMFFAPVPVGPWTGNQTVGTRRWAEEWRGGMDWCKDPEYSTFSKSVIVESERWPRGRVSSCMMLYLFSMFEIFNFLWGEMLCINQVTSLALAGNVNWGSVFLTMNMKSLKYMTAKPLRSLNVRGLILSSVVPLHIFRIQSFKRPEARSPT